MIVTITTDSPNLVFGNKQQRVNVVVDFKKDGIDGAQGNDGLAGQPGIQGLKGDKGDLGATGAQGIQGVQGLKGDNGYDGLAGQPGIQGLTGRKGDVGATGSQGIQGLKGDKGDVGATGAQGIQGIQGLKGDKGDVGATGATGAGFVGVAPNPVDYFTVRDGHLVWNRLLTIPTGLTEIVGGQFAEWNITVVLIPDFVSNIREYAFWGNSISAVTLPSNCYYYDNSFDPEVVITGGILTPNG